MLQIYKFINTQMSDYFNASDCLRRDNYIVKGQR